MKRYLGAAEVELACEADFRSRFSDCEIGGMPPIGNLYGMAIFVDESLALDEEITFNAGSHREVVRMSYGDFQNLVRPVPMTLVMHRAKGHAVEIARGVWLKPVPLG